MLDPFTRRRFVALGLRGAIGMICAQTLARRAQAAPGARLRTRPAKPKQRAQPGRHAFGLGGTRDGYLSVPQNYNPAKPIPFILMLHGRGGGSKDLETFCEAAAKEGIAVAVPDSRGRTWDRIRGQFGPDIDFLERVLAYVFERLAVNPQHLAIAGFSDGGSYSLSVGLTNGDLFSHVIAYSPQFISAPVCYGKPPVFITHGMQDRALSANFSENLVRQLKGWGYRVELKEFSGGHFMRPDLVRESFRWFVGTGR